MKNSIEHSLNIMREIAHDVELSACKSLEQLDLLCDRNCLGWSEQEMEEHCENPYTLRAAILMLERAFLYVAIYLEKDELSREMWVGAIATVVREVNVYSKKQHK
jgi:hypothetical protein